MGLFAACICKTFKHKAKILTNEPLNYTYKTRFKDVLIYGTFFPKLKATFPKPETKVTAGQCLGSDQPLEQKSEIKMCSRKAKEFRDTETLIIMLLLLPLSILSDVFVHWGGWEGTGATRQKKRMETKSSWKDMSNNCTHHSCSQLSSWLAADSGVNNSNPWPSTKSEDQFLVEFTHPPLV